MNKVFMVMPFSDDTSTNAYKNCIKKVCDEFNLEIRRADEIFTTNPVYDDIVKEIQEAAIIIVDISGKNPNVFYELGMAHTLKKTQTIMITHEDYSNIPFDVAHFRILKYADTINGAKKLEEELNKILADLLKDYKTLCKDEYDLLIEIFSHANKHSELYSLIGISKYNGILNRSLSLDAEGHTDDNNSTFVSISIENGMQTFIKMGYLTIEVDIIKLSDKGKAFVEVLLEKGFVCDRFNDQIFTNGFIPYLERLKQKSKTSNQDEIN